jgi:hypothetical protein
MKDRATVDAAPNQEISRMGREVPEGQVSSPFLMGRVPMGGSRESPTEATEEAPIRKFSDYNKTDRATTVSKEDAPSRVQKVKKKARALPRNENAPGYQMDDDKPANIGNQNTFNLDKFTDLERRKKLEESDKPLEGVYPESYLGPGRILKSVNNLAKTIANIGKNKATEKLASQNAREVLKQRAMSGTRAGQKSAEEADDLARMAGEGGPNFKKGGKAKASNRFASGGSISSASKRGDGIAQKGKTKGRIV